MSARNAAVCELHKAIDDDDRTKVMQIISQQGSQVVNETSSNGYTALYYACMRNASLDTMMQLLKQTKKVDLKGEDRETPLYIATYNNLLDHARALVSAGANVNEENGHENDTALHAAARLGYEELTKFLVTSNANINARNVKLETPLFQAAAAGKHQTLYILLEKGANRNFANHDGKQPLFIASEREHKEIVNMLKVAPEFLRDAKAHADVESKNRKQSLSEAAMERAQTHSPAEEVEQLPEPERPTPVPVTLKPISRTHDPLTGKAYGPCKSLEEVGPEVPAPIPEGVIKPLPKVSDGGTIMKVGTGTGVKVRDKGQILSAIPDSEAMDFGGVVLPQKKAMY